jgi:ATP/maltotriose-dependent transcriptional regulator MalT
MRRGRWLAVIEDDEIRQQLERSKACPGGGRCTQIARRTAELNNARPSSTVGRNWSSRESRPATSLDTLQMRLRSRAVAARGWRSAQRRQSEAGQRELSIRQGHDADRGAHLRDRLAAARGDRSRSQLGDADYRHRPPVSDSTR